MSKGVDKIKVFQTTKVRTTLKNDGFWIQKLKQEDEEQDKERTEHVVETRPSPGRQNSYVLSTAKLFESVDCPLSPPHHKTFFASPERNSAYRANGEVIPPLNDAQPEGSTVETTDDAKPQAPTEELIQNGEAQPEKSVAINGEHNDGAAEVSAEVHVAESIQNGEPDSSPEAVPAKQPVVITAAENKEVHTDAIVDQSNVEDNVSADAQVEDPIAETSAAVPEVPAAPEVEPSSEPANAAHLEGAGVETTDQPAEETCPPEDTADETVEAVAEVVAKSSSDMSDVVDATPGEEAALKESVEAVAEVAVVPEILAATDEEAAAEDAVAPETLAVTGTAGEEAALQENVEAVAEVAIVPETPAATDGEAAAEDAVAPETPAVTGTAGEEAALQESVEAVAEVAIVPEIPAATDGEAAAEDAVAPETPAVTGRAGEEAALQERVEAVAEVAVVPETPAATDGEAATEVAVVPETPAATDEEAAAEVAVVPETPTATDEEAEAEVAVVPETPAVTGAAGEEAANQVSVESVPTLVAESVSESSSQPATETATEESCETGPLEEAVAAVAEVAVESSPETPAAGEEAAPQVSMEPVPDLVADTVSVPPTQAAAAAVEPVECEVVSSVSVEPVLETRAEEAVECEVPPVDHAAGEQSVEPAPAADEIATFSIRDALETVTASDADGPVELSEALHVEPPAPKPPKQSIADMLQKYKEELQSRQTPAIPLIRPRRTNVCSFCDETIYGNTKIHLSEPMVTCHPECLKCGVCATILGDMLKPIFLRGQMVQCGHCFIKT